MAESFLRYTDLAAAIQMAKGRGLSDAQVIRALSANMSYADAVVLARRAAPLLDIPITDSCG